VVPCGRVARPGKSGDRHLGTDSPYLFENGDAIMDKDQIKQVIGGIKETVGKSAGDRKTEVDRKAKKAAGKLQNAVSGKKDTARESFKW
jgi:uncharacterized protein YjbJ (UPF0337 family)